MKSWLEQNRLAVALALVGLILIGGGVFWFKTGGQPETRVEVLSADTDQSTANDIYVDISGAVNKPGVYGLPAGSRVENAIAAAGGLALQANTKWIEVNLNRAQVLVDGTKIYIPDTSLMKIASEKININSATKSELESLPEIGPVTAEKIISGRPYQSIEELLSRKIVGQKTFATIKDQISVW